MPDKMTKREAAGYAAELAAMAEHHGSVAQTRPAGVEMAQDAHMTHAQTCAKIATALLTLVDDSPVSLGKEEAPDE